MTITRPSAAGLFCLAAGLLALWLVRSPADLALFWPQPTAWLPGAPLLAVVSLAVAAVIAERRLRVAAALGDRRPLLALEAVDAAWWERCIATGELHFGPAWETLLGYTPGDLGHQPHLLATLLHPDDRPGVEHAFAEHLAGRSAVFEVEYRCRRRDGGWTWLHDRGKLVERDRVGRPRRVAGIVTDIDRRKRRELELARTNERLSDALESMADGVTLFDAEDRLVLSNERMREFFPQSAELRVPGTTFAELLRETARRGEYAGVDATNFEEWLVAQALKGGNGRREIELTGGWCLDIVVSATRDGGRICNYRDVTARKQLERQLEREATRDPLTGLANRSLFNAQLRRARTTADRAGTSLAVILVDLDRFKAINDLHGHAAGDALLVEVARRLESCVREGDLVARLGGDEFAILAVGSSGQAGFAALAGRVVMRLAEPLRIAGAEVRPGGTVGLTVYPDDPGGPEELLASADRALYAAKTAGRGTWATHARGVRDGGRGSPEVEVTAALARGEIDLDHQPILDLDTLEPVAFEALARWHHPERGRLPAGAFVPVAERGGAILALTRFALTRALERQRAWREAGLGDLQAWVNLSPRCLAWDGLVDAVAGALAATGVPPDRLVLEVTEGVLADMPGVETRLATLRLLGLAFAVDDFGAGHSSLGRLATLPVVALKTDRALLAGIAGDRRDWAVARAAAALADDLGLRSVAEGIETHDQLRAASRLGFRLGQGYLLARPMPAAEVPGWLARWRERRWAEGPKPAVEMPRTADLALVSSA